MSLPQGLIPQPEGRDSLAVDFNPACPPSGRNEPTPGFNPPSQPEGLYSFIDAQGRKQ